MYGKMYVYKLRSTVSSAQFKMSSSALSNPIGKTCMLCARGLRRFELLLACLPIHRKLNLTTFVATHKIKTTASEPLE